MATQTDYYALLGVARSATDEQIRSAYRKLARQYHPDVNSASDAAERFKPGTSTSTCATCNGRGEVRQVQQSVFGRFVNVSTCPRCGGAGKTVDKQCARCRGEGRERKDREIGLSIPAGIDDGQQLRVAGEGEAGMRGGPTGD